MGRTESEQEFVLGNKQLLSAFFVVVALLGVFFVMGYIIGRNTGSADPSAKKGTSTEPAPVAAAFSTPEPVPPVAAAPEPTTARPAERTQSAEPETTAEKPAPKIEKPAPKPAEAAASDVPGQVESSAGHTYLQVTALKRPAADNIVKVLRERDFPALLGESSKPGYFRVLVGPYSDPEKLSKAKTDIKKMGFEPAVLR